MDTLRLELRLSGGPNLGSRTVVEGAVAGSVLGAVIDPAGPTVRQTILPSRVARQMQLAEAGDTLAEGVHVTAGTHVITGKNKKKHGNLSRLWVERATNHLTHILFTLDREARVVEVAHIASFSDKEIVLDEAITNLNDLPVYRDDPTLAGYVGLAIENALLDPHARRSLHARVEDGQVDLSGLLETQEQFDAVFSAIKHTPGVRAVRSDVVVTEQIADFVAAAIDQMRAKGELDDSDDIEVLAEHQIVYLNGQVGTLKKKAAVEREALGVAGVRLVVNQLRTLEPEKTERADPASPPTHLR
jgi:osmotically-inducible protein OsmY